MKPQIRHAVIAVILLLWSATFAMAASVSIVPAGGNKYTVQGDNMDGVAGIDMIISYDGSLISANPVTQGSLIAGAMMAANTNNPGSIKIAIISTKAFSGSGPIATITFARVPTSVKIASANMINSSGASISGSVNTGTPDPSTLAGKPFSEPAPTPSPTPTATPNIPTTPSGSSTPATLGAVNIAPDAFLKDESKAADAAETPVAPAADTAPATVADATPAEQTAAARPEEPKKSEEIKFTSYSSIVERFRTYQGEKTPKILAALFKKEISPNIRQEPPVALSNGITNVTIIATLSADGKSPNFALNGAKLVSLKKDEDSAKWIIETLPIAKALKVSLTIQNGNEVIEFPLTVAPALSDVDASETGFISYLKNKTADLNDDGKHDHIDDFIFTANYLVEMDKLKPAEKTKPAGKAKP